MPFFQLLAMVLLINTYLLINLEVMGALLSVLVIWVLTGVLVYMAIQRIITKEYEVDAEVMLITASGGLLINVL